MNGVATTSAVLRRARELAILADLHCGRQWPPSMQDTHAAVPTAFATRAAFGTAVPFDDPDVGRRPRPTPSNGSSGVDDHRRRPVTVSVS